ncbi:MATE family efflux transporter [uncultured Gemmiger sp.]|uniref:MATE family efflux transporter n=1 Tax=uncultured Gemmiger sp. TaxID=1623490 RepID=UPI0025D55DAD|nr:MATE family efflux transporter [uncultured Gemmiger sp.]
MTRDLTSGNPLKVILLFALPLVLGNLFQQFYSLADTIIVGRFVGVNALAAVGSTSSINYMIIGFVTGLCNGFAIPIAQYFGAREPANMRRYVANATWLCLIGALLLTVVTVLLTRPILELMQTPADIIDDAATYIGWIFGGIPFVFLYNMVACIMRALGDSRTPLIFLVITSALNVGLDLFFIIVFDAGVFGAAFATDLSQAISGIASLVYLIKKFDIIHLKTGEKDFNGAICGKLMAMGLPMGLQCSITAIGSIIMQWAVNVLGSTAVAAVTAAGKTSNLLSVPLESIGTAMATYAGQNLGAARLDRVRAGVNCALGISVVYAVGSLVFLHFFDVTIIDMFIDTGAEMEVVGLAQSYLFWNSLFFLPLGALIVWRYDIQGLGYSSIAMMAGVAEMIARTAVALVLVPWLGFFGASLSNPAAWIAACIFLLPAYNWTMRHLANRLHAGRLQMESPAAD